MTCGPTRNVTSYFATCRAEQNNKKNRFGYSILGGGAPSASHQRGDQRLLAYTSDEDNGDIELVSNLPPVWVDIVEEAQDDMNQIKDKLSSLQKAQQKRLLKVFDSESKKSGYPDREIDTLTIQITEMIKKCEGRIHQIQSRGLAVPLSASEHALRQNSQRGIATQLQHVSQIFRKQQKHYLEELKKRDLDTSDIEAGKRAPFDDGFNDTLMAELDHMEHDVDTRNEEISKIARSVVELHTIFKELSALVIDQGTVLDRIDYNIEQVATHTQDANVHLRKAEEYQKSGRATGIIGCLVSTIAVLIVIFILKHSIF